MAARTTPPGEEPEHGTISRYRYHGCRCDDCRWANRIQKRIERTGDPNKGMRTAQHGSRSKYNHGCRCGLCKEAHRVYQREYWAKARSEGKLWTLGKRERERLLAAPEDEVDEA